MRAFLALFFSLLLLIPAKARPVSFVGGKTVMVNHDAKETSAIYHYTLNPKTSLGLRTIHREGFRTSINAIEVNHLAHRDNGEDHQANIYLRGGLGLAAFDEAGEAGLRRSIEPAGYIGMSTDWENRRFFVSYENKYEAVSGQDGKFKQSARVGIAPYVAEFGELHTWLMLEVNHDLQDKEGPVTLRPLVRFFKDVHLIELGINNRQEVMVNYIGRF